MRLPPRAPAEQLLSAGATKELGHKLAVAFLETTDIHYVTILKKNACILLHVQEFR